MTMTMRLGDKISACVLTYNHVHIIESTLMSILHQTVDGHEVIVSDDQSTDGTWEKVLALSTKHPRLKTLRTPRNLGMAAHANLVVGQCSRPYIALLHHDDLYRQDLLEKWGSLLDAHTDVAFVFNPYQVHQSDHIYETSLPAGRIHGKWFLEHYLLPNWGCVVRGTAMIRKTAWDAAGGMRTEFDLLADIDLWMRLARSWAVGYVDEPVITVRHDQPSYYPDIYQDGFWSWRRQRFLYEVHGHNRREMLDETSLRDRLTWHLFRHRVSLETAKWLAYAVVRRRHDMVRTSSEGATRYDLPALVAFRWLLQKGLSLVPESMATES